MTLCSSPVSHVLRSFDTSTMKPRRGTLDNDVARDNYTNWSACMKNYLLGQDLWDVIEASSEPKPEDSEADFKTWRKKNAIALLAIQNSCEPDILSQIREITSAKVAWDTLAKIYEPEPPTVNSGESTMLQEPQPPANNQGIQNIIDYSQLRPLHEALEKGNWGFVADFLVENPNAITAKMTAGQIPLHVATVAGHLTIVENLVDRMSGKDLEIRDVDGYTALGAAAIYGWITIAECMIRKNKNLVTITDVNGLIPLTVACSFASPKAMINYLYSVTPLEFLLSENGTHGSLALHFLIKLNMFDVALDLLRHCPNLAITRNHKNSIPVISLSQSPFAFPSGCRLRFWQWWIYSCISVHLPAVSSDIRVNIPHTSQNERKSNIVQVLCQFRGLVLNLLELFGIKQIYDMKFMHTYAREVLHCMSGKIATLDGKKFLECGVYHSFSEASKHGITEFIMEFIKANSNLMISTNDEGRSIFLCTIVNRQEKIFSLLYGFGARKFRVVSGVDYFENNMLHLAGILTPSSQLDRISGAALQMQRELQWYKEVESIVNPSYRELMNSDYETPRQVFTKNHKELLKEGEKWMKETSTSCTVVGALIITIMFAAAFTVPGGNDQSGYPIFLHEKPFMIFIISDAISLFASSTSVLMFFGILTSRYAEDDFLKALPTRLIIGLSTLFFSIAAMMVTFSAALFIMLQRQYSWITIPIILFASVPVTLFVLLQFPLLVEIVRYTYGPSIFDRKMKPWL